MKVIRLTTLLVFLLAFVGLQANFADSVSAQAGKVFLTAMHSDLKGIFCSLSASTGANNTVWNAYVQDGIHPALYGGTVLAGTPVPYLAAEFASPITKEGNNLVSTVKLLRGVKWSDGSEVTSDDVAFTYNLFASKMKSGRTLSLELGGGWAHAAWDKVVRVEAVDKYTVKFVLSAKPGLAEWEFTLLVWDIFQKAYWEPKVKDALATADPVRALAAIACPGEPGTGPFVTKQWKPGEFAEIAANPNYSFKGTVTKEYEGGGMEETLPAAIGGATRKTGDTTKKLLVTYTEGPNVDGVLYNLFGSQAAAALAVKGGQVDYHFNPLGYGLATLRDLEATPGVKVTKNADRGVFYMAFNMRRSPYNYREFRAATRCVIDKEFVANAQLAGQVFPSYSTVAPGNAFWHRPLTEAEKAEACIGLSEADRLKKARELLDKAGFKFNAQGRMTTDPEGKAVAEQRLLHPNAAYDNNRNIFGLHIVDRLNKLGVPVRDVPAGFNNIVTLVFDEQDFDMWQLGWSLGRFPDYLEAFFHSRNTEIGGNAAQGGVCGAREDKLNGCQASYDKLADQFLAEQDLNKAQGLARELQRLVFANVGYIETHHVQSQDSYRSDRINWQGIENQPLLGGISVLTGLRSLVKK